MFRRKNTRDTTEDKAALKPGTLMADQTLFGGEFNGELVFAMPTDVQNDEGGGNLLMTRKQALALRNKMNAEGRLGHNDWDLATPAEMKMLIGNLSASFNLTSTKDIDVGDGPGTVGWYMTSGTDKTVAPPLLEAVIACKNEILPVPENELISVRFIRREKSSANLEVASAPRVPAKKQRGAFDFNKALNKAQSKMYRKPDKASDILAESLESVPEQETQDFLNWLLYRAVCSDTRDNMGVAEMLLEAGANPNAEFNGVKGEILAAAGFHHKYSPFENSVFKALYKHEASLDDAVDYMTDKNWASTNINTVKRKWARVKAEEAKSKPATNAASAKPLAPGR